MPDGGAPRRTRLRLARHGPGPSRVRARERADEPEASSRLGGLNLLALGAAVTIVASLGGLVTTGIGTIWSARVSADQLAQSREQAEEKQREQAARVSLWEDVGPKSESRLHVMNRSPDPLSNLLIVFLVSQDPPGDVAFQVEIPALTACSVLTIEGKSLKYYVEDDPSEGDSSWPPLSEADAKGIDLGDFEDRVGFLEASVGFQDRNGVYWARFNGALTRGDVSIGRTPGRYGQVVGWPQVKPVDNCGDDGGN